MLLELSTLPDLILLDVRMPVMDGYEFREVQSRTERIRHIPVLIMTGDCDVNMSKDMNHPCGVLVKPLGMTSMIETISTYI